MCRAAEWDGLPQRADRHPADGDASDSAALRVDAAPGAEGGPPTMALQRKIALGWPEHRPHPQEDLA